MKATVLGTTVLMTALGADTAHSRARPLEIDAGRAALGSVAAAAAPSASGGSARAGVARSGPLHGAPPAPVPLVDLDASDEPVGDILSEIAEQAGLDLVLAAPRSFVRQSLTLRLKSRPADQAIAAVLQAAQLEGEFDGKLLTVRAAAGATVAAAEPTGEPASRSSRRRPRRGGDDGRVERILFGQPLVIEVGERVDQAVVIGGPLKVRGHVEGDAVAIGGPVLVAAGAVVDGDVVSIGGPVKIEEGAVVHGDKVALGGAMGKGVGGLITSFALGDLFPAIASAFGVAATVVRYLTLLAIALLLIAFVPERVQRVRSFVAARPGASAAAGFAMLVGALPLSILLAITIIGLPLVLVVLFLLLAFLVMGLTALMLLVGERLPLLKDRKTPVVAVLLGLAILVLVDLIPVLGTLVVLVAAFVAGGAALLSRFGGEPKIAAPAVPASSQL